MKYIHTLLLLLFTFGMFGQELTYGISEIEYENETVKTINIKLEPKPSTIENKLEDWLNSNYDVDLDGKKFLFFNKEFLTAKGVVVPKVTTSKIDVVVKVEENESNITTINMFASFGYNNWITPEEHPFEFSRLEEIAYEFIADYLPTYYKEQIVESKEVVDDLLEKEGELRKDIASNKIEIQEAEEENMELMERLRQNQIKLRKAKLDLAKKGEEYRTVKEKVDMR